MSTQFKTRTLFVALLGILLNPIFSSVAEEKPDNITPTSITLSPVVVTATRVEESSFDLPVSIDVVDGEVLREGQLRANLSENAARVPGVIINNRNNAAQDLAIQIRGFGARSAFGVRGVRLYADSIPMTMPDGQGQTGTFNLDTAKSVEFLKGSFSALYGNSSGGVVQIFTEDGSEDPTISAGAIFGSYGTYRTNLTFGDDRNDVNYIVNGSLYRSNGYRDNSYTRRDSVHGKIKFKLNNDSNLTIVATALNQPDNQDPQGLTATEYQSDPKQASAPSLTFKTRVTRRHEQLGVTLEHDLTENDTLRLMGYYGERQNEQFLSTTVGAQASVLNGGGVSTINREFGGVDLRWNHVGKLGALPYNLTAGISYDLMGDVRQGYENFVGATLGVKGALRRDEDNDLFSFDQYLQGSLDIHPRWTVSGGVRHSRVSFKATDRFFNGVNGDDSGSVTHSDTTPVAGVVFRLTESLNLYANAGESFETPTFVELSYRDSVGGGLNFGLQPATSRQYEVGAKASLLGKTLINLSFFKIDTDNEIVVLSQAGGRTVFQNVPSTERKGLELSVDSRPIDNLRLFMAYTLLDAEFSSPFRACNIPAAGINFCNAGTLETIQAGGEIPGTYKHTVYGEASWKHAPTGFSTALEMRNFSKTYVNYDLTDGAAKSYTLFNWRGGFSQDIQGWKLSEFVRIENLADKKYVGSVRVADINARFYDPAPGRNWLIGLNAEYKF
jgi:iron complex outermembrane receptor protein